MQLLKNISAVILGLAILTFDAHAIPVTWESNGHQYELIRGSYTWDEANSLVEDGWHLATITSAEEQNFIMTSFADYYGEFWLGGFQKDETDRIGEADQNWHWVTGEEWNYTNWADWEPNEWRGYVEDGLGIWNNGRNWNWDWNDEHGRSNIRGYIVEYSVSVPEPAAYLLILSGLTGLFLARRKIKV